MFTLSMSTFRLPGKKLIIEKIRINFIAQSLEVEILIEDCLYNPSDFKWIIRAVYERYCTMRDELVRPHWLEFIEVNAVKYRIKRPKPQPEEILDYPVP